jgi:hypothetical protein
MLRRQFATRANAIGQWLESHLDAVSSIGLQRGSSLEEQLNKLRAIDRDVAAYRGTIDDLYRSHEAVQEAMIFDNQHTPYTAEVRTTASNFAAEPSIPQYHRVNGDGLPVPVAAKRRKWLIFTFITFW